MRAAVAQTNPTIGDVRGNVDLLRRAYDDACAAGADIVIAPELAVTGYPPRDLLDRPSFVRDAMQAAAALVRNIGDVPLVFGAVTSGAGDPFVASETISNAAVVAQRGSVVALHRKILLPTYDIFDEARYFTPGDVATVVTLLGKRVGLSVCEDSWNDATFWERPRYKRDPLQEQAAAGAELLFNISASPYERGKAEARTRMLANTSKRFSVPLVYANQVGGNDSVIFDGRSLAFDKTGALILRAPAFTSALSFVDPFSGQGELCEMPASKEADMTEALVLGLRDYVQKCGFRSVVLGLSGGIDSALVAALAVRALGPERVHGVAMPSRYSSQHSVDDALDLARRLGIGCDVVAIEPMFQAYLGALAQPFAGLPEDVTEENLQARIRGALVMAYSNKRGSLVLTTGNKSEVAVGYCTLYGDMCGGLAVISDVFKTEVYAIARHLNATSAVPPIPESTIVKPPSAELRPNQTDQDSLPPYDVLDAVLRLYVEDLLPLEDIVGRGFAEPLVRRVVKLCDQSEYKRRQMAPGLKVSKKAFGEGRRLPVAQKYFQ